MTNNYRLSEPLVQYTLMVHIQSTWAKRGMQDVLKIQETLYA